MDFLALACMNFGVGGGSPYTLALIVAGLGVLALLPVLIPFVAAFLLKGALALGVASYRFLRQKLKASKAPTLRVAKVDDYEVRYAAWERQQADLAAAPPAPHPAFAQRQRT